MVLNKAGFTIWKGIEMDAGLREVDDAVDGQSGRFDPSLHGGDVTISSREAD